MNKRGRIHPFSTSTSDKKPATIGEMYDNLREDSNAQRDTIDELNEKVNILLEHLNRVQGTEQEKGILAAKVESLRDFIDSYGLGLIAD